VDGFVDGEMLAAFTFDDVDLAERARK